MPPVLEKGVAEHPFIQIGDARKVHRNPRPSNVEIRADDPALTGHAGLLLTGDLAARTDLVARLDRAVDAVRPFKQRRQGCSGGELLVALATTWRIWTRFAKTRPGRSCERRARCWPRPRPGS